MAELKTPVLIIHTESPNTDERNFVGHYYVELRDANGDWVVAGLMPKQTGGNPLPQPGYIEYADGQRVPPYLDSHKSESSKPIPLTQKQYQDAKDYIDRARQSHPIYFALGQNCVDFVVAVLRAACLSSEIGNYLTTSQLQEMSGANLYRGAGYTMDGNSQTVESDMIRRMLGRCPVPAEMSQWVYACSDPSNPDIVDPSTDPNASPDEIEGWSYQPYCGQWWMRSPPDAGSSPTGGPWSPDTRTVRVADEKMACQLNGIRALRLKKAADRQARASAAGPAPAPASTDDQTLSPDLIEGWSYQVFDGKWLKCRPLPDVDGFPNGEVIYADEQTSCWLSGIRAERLNGAESPPAPAPTVAPPPVPQANPAGTDGPPGNRSELPGPAQSQVAAANPAGGNAGAAPLDRQASPEPPEATHQDSQAVPVATTGHAAARMAAPAGATGKTVSVTSKAKVAADTTPPFAPPSSSTPILSPTESAAPLASSSPSAPTLPPAGAPPTPASAADGPPALTETRIVGKGYTATFFNGPAVQHPRLLTQAERLEALQAATPPEPPPPTDRPTTFTVDEVRAIAREAVREALREQAAEPRQFSRQELTVITRAVLDRLNDLSDRPATGRSGFDGRMSRQYVSTYDPRGLRW